MKNEIEKLGVFVAGLPVLFMFIALAFFAHAQDPTPPAEEAVEAVVEEVEAEGQVEPQPEPEPEPVQAEPEPELAPEPVEPENGMGLLYLFLSGGGLMGLLQVLRKTGVGPQSVPATFRPFVAPAVALLAWGANQLFGAPLDFSMLEAILIGGGASVAHNAGSSAKLLASSGGTK